MKKLLLVLFLFLAAPAYAVEIKEVKSPGGLTAWMVEEHALPLVHFRALFKNAGASYDPPGKEGRAMLVTELMLEGAGERDALAFIKTLEEHAIRFSVNVDEDFFTVTFSTLSENKALAFSLLNDMLLKPRMEAASIERVQQKALAGLKQLEQDPFYLQQRGLAEAVYGTHPYAQTQEGTAATIKSLGKKDFLDFMNRHLARENLQISVAGDITPVELESFMDKTFGALPEKTNPARSVEEATLPEKASERVIAFDIPQTFVAFSMPGIKRTDPDYLVAHMMNYLLGGGMSSRLSKEIREDRGLTYGVSSGLNPMPHAATLTGQFSTRNEQAKEAVSILRATLRKYAEEGVTEEELADAKRYLTGSFVLSLDTNRELTSLLSTMQLYQLGMDYIDKRNALLAAITTEQVNAMAKKLVDTNRMTVVLVGKPGGIGSAR